MNLALWIATVLLSVVFLGAGTAKLIVPTRKLATAPGGGWVADFGAGTVKLIGALEILAVAGLILPAVTGIAPILVPLAATGLVVVMVGAMVTHLRRHEPTATMANLAYLALAAFVAWGRFGPYSFLG